VARRVDQIAVGLALYVDFAATPAHWAAYRQGWCAADG